MLVSVLSFLRYFTRIAGTRLLRRSLHQSPRSFGIYFCARRATNKINVVQWFQECCLRSDSTRTVNVVSLLPLGVRSSNCTHAISFGCVSFHFATCQRSICPPKHRLKTPRSQRQQYLYRLVLIDCSTSVLANDKIMLCNVRGTKAIDLDTTFG